MHLSQSFRKNQVKIPTFFWIVLLSRSGTFFDAKILTFDIS